MTNKTITLACPFCGSKDLKQVTDDGIHFTQCKSCEATGPTGFKRGDDDAVGWDTRSALAEPVPPAVDQLNTPERLVEDGLIGPGVLYRDAPVPPAGGEPEVVGRQCFPSEEMAKVQAYRKTPWIDDGVGQQPSTPGFYRVEPLIRLSDHRAHVTRLQAEVSEFRMALQVANKNTKQVRAQRDARQAELIKARELLTADYQLLGLNSSLVSYREQMKAIATFLSNQSAPADKESSDGKV